MMSLVMPVVAAGDGTVVGVARWVEAHPVLTALVSTMLLAVTVGGSALVGWRLRCRRRARHRLQNEQQVLVLHRLVELQAKVDQMVVPLDHLGALEDNVVGQLRQLRVLLSPHARAVASVGEGGSRARLRPPLRQPLEASGAGGSAMSQGPQSASAADPASSHLALTATLASPYHPEPPAPGARLA